MSFKSNMGNAFSGTSINQAQEDLIRNQTRVWKKSKN